MKKLLAGALTATMLFSSMTALAVDYGAEYQKLPTPQTVQKFSDVPSTHWAFDYIGEMAQRNVISGYPDGRFIPENQVTRAEFAKIMVCAAGLTIKTPVTVDGKSYEQFQKNPTQGVGYNYGCVFLSDNSWIWDVFFGDWYAPYILTAANYLNFYTNEYDEGLDFKPNQPALREDIAVALVKLKGYDISLADESILNMFTDSYSISSSARKYVAVAVERGIVSGYEDNTFRGQATITRAEAATLLWRAFQYGNDNKVVEPGNGTNISTGNGQGNINTITNPTEEPKHDNIEPTPVQTTERPTDEPTNTPEPTEKPYKVDTLVKADVKAVNGLYYGVYTFDGNNTIYYCGDDNTVYSVDVNTGSTDTVLTPEDVIIDNDEMTLEDFEIDNVFYDKPDDELYISGKYKTLKTANDVNNSYLYAVSNGDIRIVTDAWSNSRVEGVTSTDGWLDRPFIETDDCIYMWYPTSSNQADIRTVMLYGSPDNEGTVFSTNSSRGGFSDSSVVTADSSTNTVTIYNLKGKELSTITPNDYSVKDKKKIDFATSNGGWSLFLTSNNNIIFYDTNAKAFRMISEND